MPPEFEKFLSLATGIPIEGAYLLLAAGAAIENIFPPVPSDTFMVLGGILVDRGVLQGGTVLGVVWASNVLTAIFVYLMARRYGQGIFATSWGHWLLRPHQLDRVADFYTRFGLIAIFGSRFLPVLRVVVPAFAGIAGLGFFSTVIPLALASGLWYGVLLYAGILASRNLFRLFSLLDALGGWLAGVTLVLMLAVVVWWLRTRKHRLEEDAGQRADGPVDEGER